MTKIEWTEKTWNPIVGCSVVSPGCTNCYAMKMAARLEAMAVSHNANHTDPHHDSPLGHYIGLTQRSKAGPVWTGKIALAPEKTLLEPLRRKKPTTYFVNSMSDLFHEDVPDAWIDQVFAVMALTPQHTYQVLTKRSARMRAYCSSASTCVRVLDRMFCVAAALAFLAASSGHPRPWEARPDRVPFMSDPDEHWPLPNVWLGISAEDQKRADERIPDLLATPAAVRFVSAEPLLGPIDFRAIGPIGNQITALEGRRESGAWQTVGLDWIIVGGESGRGARPMHPDWARNIRDQCVTAGVPYFFKQWGEFAPASVAYPGDHNTEDANLMCQIGKARAGRLLDDREWNEMPAQKSMARMAEARTRETVS